MVTTDVYVVMILWFSGETWWFKLVLGPIKKDKHFWEKVKKGTNDVVLDPVYTVLEVVLKPTCKKRESSQCKTEYQTPVQ